MRGKHAASSATKRANDLEAEVARLNALLATERELARVAAMDYSMEIRDIRSRINAEAKALHRAGIKASVESAVVLRVKREVKALVESRLVEVAGILARGPFAVNESVELEQTLAKVARALGVTAHGGVIVDAFYAARPGTSSITGNRATRRAPARYYSRDLGEIDGEKGVRE